MLEDVSDLSLARINQITQAWVEQDYHHLRHREIGTTPIKRYLESPDVGRDCPDSAALRRAFRRTVNRKTRRSDGTVSLEATRYEIPSRYRHLENVRLPYARWNLSEVELLDPNAPTALCRLYPVDKSISAEGRRRTLPPTDGGIVDGLHATADAEGRDDAELPPLLRKILADSAATGLPAPYLPKCEREPDPESDR